MEHRIFRLEDSITQDKESELAQAVYNAFRFLDKFKSGYPISYEQDHFVFLSDKIHRYTASTSEEYITQMTLKI